jgi:type IX secretion system PorP/SprF family membrane protein
MKKTILSLTGCLFGLLVQAQDLSFSQFYEQPLLRNPALAGIFDGDVRVAGIFRNQWQAITVPYKTGSASVEVKWPINARGKEDYLITGLQLTHDVAGDVKLKRTQLFPTFTFIGRDGFFSDEDFWSVGFTTGYTNSQFDPTLAKFDDQFVNGSFNPNNPTMQVINRSGFSYFDLGIGGTYNAAPTDNTTWYIGAGWFHLNRPRVAFNESNDTSRLNTKFTLNLGVSTWTSETNQFILFADYFRQGGHRQFLGGVMYGIELSENYYTSKRMALYLGGYYRWNDAFIPVVKLDVYGLTFGLSYDVNASKLKSASQWRGGMELSTTYTMRFNRRSAELRKLRCVGSTRASSF